MFACRERHFRQERLLAIESVALRASPDRRLDRSMRSRRRSNGFDV
jgi:hypothetical protein